jgi:2-keto-4-pentenoate hydratase/2-oxohepta-3-ene-1,7-dioic acid hydratase in catechol pathway
MKLARFRTGERECIGAVEGDQVVDLRAALTAAMMGAGMSHDQAAAEAAERIPGNMREFLAGGGPLLQVAHEAVAFAHAYPDHLLAGQPISYPLASTPLLCPIGDPQKIICVGQNYRDHCEEQNQPLPERAIIFAKFASALTHPGAPILLPKASEKVDYEAELAFVIGKRAKHVSEEDAKDYVAGYMCFDDVSARDIQMHPAEKQWIRGKSPDTFAPCGPYLVTADEIADPHDLDIQLTLNGEVMQKSNTSNLIFGVYYLVSHLSKTMTLEPGDIVATGTPGGVGAFRNPPVWLKPGDEVSVAIEGLGTLTNPVAAE